MPVWAIFLVMALIFWLFGFSVVALACVILALIFLAVDYAPRR
jgi:hypothetical protein